MRRPAPMMMGALLLGAAQLAAGAGQPAAGVEQSAWADETHYGVAPSLSGGAALFTSASPLPSFVGLTGLGVEILGEATPWGGFLRGDYLSSGGDGRWTAVTFAAGPSRRMLGDVNHFSLVARAGLSYAHWHAANGGCSPFLFVPRSCQNTLTPPPGSPPGSGPVIFDANADALGLLMGARLEFPVRPIYFALDASLTPAVAFDTPPGGVVALQINLLIAFHDWRGENAPPAPPEPSREEPGLRRRGL